MVEESDILKFIYKGGKTKRFHTADTLTEQTVADHSFGVAWLVYLIEPSASKELIMAALAHDLAEHLVGDVASPAKHKNPELRQLLNAAEAKLLEAHHLAFEHELNNHEQLMLKIADIFDGMMYCVRERRLGSRAVEKVYDNFNAYFRNLAIYDAPNEYRIKLYHAIINGMWEKYNASK